MKTKTPPSLAMLAFPDALVNISVVSAITGLSASSIFRKTTAGQFPEPVRMSSRCTRWKAGSVMAWLKMQQPAGSGKGSA